MTNLVHWNPFKTLARFDPTASFDEFARNLRQGWGELELSPGMRIDVNEDDKAYKVKAEIPGVDKKDIDVSIDGNQVAIGAEVKRESSKKDSEKEIYTERYFGKIYRTFTLPNDLDSAKAEANYNHGVLTLTLPKKANGSSNKRIAVA
jgi:HSP20 family protein